MKTIQSIADLQESILLLEIQKEGEKTILKNQVKETYESLKPINMIKNFLDEATDMSDVKGGLLDSSISLLSGYLSKKVIFGSTHNPLKIFMGTLIQVGITSLVSKHASEIKSVTSRIANLLIAKVHKPA